MQQANRQQQSNQPKPPQGPPEKNDATASSETGEDVADATRNAEERRGDGRNE